MTTKYEVWYTPAEWDGEDLRCLGVFDSLEEAREYVKTCMKIRWEDLLEEYPTIEDVESHHLFASDSESVTEAVYKYYTEDIDFSEVMGRLKWRGYSPDPRKNIVEAYYEDWLLGCGGYDIIKSEE